MAGNNYLSRMLSKLYIKTVVPFKEKTFKGEQSGKDIHYLFYRNQGSKTLIIGFQAFNAGGPRYNYVTSLSKVPADRLYIKDDFIERTGNYYLGSNKTYGIEKDVFALINKIRSAFSYEKLIFIGSSKGGYAAINFGIEYPGSVMIVAAPQYYLGAYMTDATKFHIALEDILGRNYSEENVKELDKHLPDKILHSEKGLKQKVYLHCSINESTYEKHCAWLMEDLRRTGREVIFNEGTYEDHGNLKHYFPNFLIHSLSKEVI